MKFSEYAKKLNNLLETNPEYGDFDVVCSIDESDSYYRKVYFGPSVGHFDGMNIFIPSDNTYENEEENALCVN